ncbi:MAG TPA: TadE/TadG family type IV pilus assembly protein [Acidimicrobiia bacterium]|nr:TadE/TadG family type IV pilus assembly protein [Acidimicrobiia bacterium]
MASRHHIRRDERGANLVEFVLVLPLLVLLVFGIIEFGVNFDRKIGVNSAAREGARAAIVGNAPGCDATAPDTLTAAEIKCFVQDRLGLSDSDVEVEVIAASGSEIGDPIKVCVEYPAESITLLFAPLLNGAELRSSATMRIEQDKNQASGGDPLGWCT